MVAYKKGVQWAVDTKKTVGDAARLNATADRTALRGDGLDLSFISVAVVDSNGDSVPRANNAIKFAITGPGQIVSTDNGDPTDMTVFPSLTRKAFNGFAWRSCAPTPARLGRSQCRRQHQDCAGGAGDFAGWLEMCESHKS